MSEPERRVLPARVWATTLGAVLVALVALWHASPLLLWHTTLEAELAAEDAQGRLFSQRVSGFAAPPDAWPELVAGALSLRAPLAPEALPACGRCARECRLPLDNRGTLALFGETLPESYDEMLDRFAPDPGDLSLTRSVSRNWRTIDALTDRVRGRTQPNDSFRFDTRWARGVVTHFRVDGVRRYVVYAFTRDHEPVRVLGVTGLSRERFDGVLGGLRIDPERDEREAGCSRSPASVDVSRRQR